ncbi:MAG: riboflavin synthase [Alphaproteobacteria bacterium]|nr:riboflavin synthase [Alphaproteobacteria bacterium]
MFTGLVEDIGTIAAVRPEGAGRALTLRTSIPMAEVALGDSIAVNGACLTAERFVDGGFVAVAATETLQKTTLGGLRVGAKVHLERALRLGDRLDGHIVQGHVDGTGTVVSSGQQRESWVLWVRMPAGIARYVAAKGSITIDGVSLTVNEIADDAFRVNLVPHTIGVTLLGELRAGSVVNLEVDVLAKYVERLLGGRAGGLTLDKLREHGFG